MTISISSSEILKLLHVLSWIIFIGVSIEAGGYIFNTIYCLWINPGAGGHFWDKADLSGLFAYDRGHFAAMAIYISVVAVLKATMFYQIVRILAANKLDMAQPFNKDVLQFMFSISGYAMLIGVNCWVGAKYAAWLQKKGVIMPGAGDMGFGGADVWIFMGVVLLVIAHIFKKGYELQTESELTV